jgi:hypothetical protein
VVLLAEAGPPGSASPDGNDGYLTKVRDLAQQEQNPKVAQQIQAVRQQLADWVATMQSASVPLAQKDASHQALLDRVKTLAGMCPIPPTTIPPPTTSPSPP